GKLAEKGKDKAGHINLIVITDRKPENEQQEEENLKRKLNLKFHHPLHLKFFRKIEKEKIPKTAKKLI
ncbi:hypothetical protein, partial [Persephonella sp.]